MDDQSQIPKEDQNDGKFTPEVADKWITVIARVNALCLLPLIGTGILLYLAFSSINSTHDNQVRIIDKIFNQTMEYQADLYQQNKTIFRIQLADTMSKQIREAELFFVKDLTDTGRAEVIKRYPSTEPLIKEWTTMWSDSEIK